MPGRGSTELCGVLAVDKPPGVTSHDVVNHLRRMTGEGRVGHGGTLDPFATGVLVLAIGPATRLLRFFSDSDKTYRAVVSFGAETDTCDPTGTPTATSPVPDAVTDADLAARTVAGLVGAFDQVPPAHSAVRVDGRKAYDLARRGAPPTLAARPVAIREATLVEVVPGEEVAWTIDLTVSKGTYVRSIARDLGRFLGTHAHLASLRRTSSGGIALDDAWSLEDLDALDERGLFPQEAFLDSAAVLGMPVLELDPNTAREVSVGARLPSETAPGAKEGANWALAFEGKLVAVYRTAPQALEAEVVLPERCR